MIEERALPGGGRLGLDPRWLDASEADAVFGALRSEVRWEARSIRLFGREVLQPRLMSWVGDPSAVYVYSRVRWDPQPWTPTLSRLRDRLVDQLGVPFDSVLCNLYRDGQDSMGKHADDEPELGEDPVIASISLGATRRFLLGNKRDKALQVERPLTHGSLLVMAGATQRDWVHWVPKERRVAEERINLTFRWIRFPRGGG